MSRTPVLYFCPTCGQMLADEPDGPCCDCLDFGVGCVVVPGSPKPEPRKPKPAWWSRRVAQPHRKDS